ncbi:MAG: carbohydrate ABC transporter permease [Rhodomicrobiaceae bacterium]
MSAVTTSAPSLRRRRQSSAATIALIPAFLIVVIAYLGCMIWTVALSFTPSRMLPVMEWAGLAQYERLFGNDRFLVSVTNTFILGAFTIGGCLIFGFLLAVFIDQRVRGEAIFRTIFLYPYSMSFVVTGLAWQWFFNPTLGLEKLVRDLGFETFTFNWLINQEMVIYTIVIAIVWQGSGLVMCILLAGLRGIDESLWKAARIDGVPAWRYYISIVLPLLGPMIVTSVVVLSIGVIKIYDLVVAMTRGGPGIASDVPAKFVMDHLFERNNVGLATAAATMMLITVAALLAPWIYVRGIRTARGRG